MSQAEKLATTILGSLDKEIPGPSDFENEFHKFSYLEQKEDSESGKNSGKNGLQVSKAQLITLIYKFANTQK